MELKKEHLHAVLAYAITFIWVNDTQRWCRVVSISAPYSWGLGVKSRLADRLSHLKLSAGFLNLSKHVSEWYISLDHDGFIPHNFMSIIIH
jgi:hypothetical protein